MIRNSKGQFVKKEFMSTEDRQFFVNINKGRKASEEAKQKMRGKRKGGHKWSKEAKENMKLRQSGKGNHNYKIGKTLVCEGYVALLMPEHPFSRNNYYLEHRYIVEQKIGRYLKKEEVVHHINEIITDNRIENLYLFPSSKEHSSYHGLLYWGKIEPITKSNLL